MGHGLHGHLGMTALEVTPSVAAGGLHLVGAAYCDVFTCDRATSLSLGDVRTRLGRRKQLAVGHHPGGVESFVSDLTATWP